MQTQCRLSGGGQSGRAQSAEKALEKLNAEKVEKPFETRKRQFRFPPVENMGERVAVIEHLTHGYNGRALFEDQSLEVVKGDRIAIIGPNGAGKSTLLRLLMGTEKPQEGIVRLGEHSILPNYYQQNQSEALDPKLTVLETLTHAADQAAEDEIKSLLGRMMFARSAFDKKVGVLSGGEKARLALAKFMLTKGTLLVLDEPTNHLDIPSKEMLEEAVCAFEGSVSGQPRPLLFAQDRQPGGHGGEEASERLDWRLRLLPTCAHLPMLTSISICSTLSVAVHANCAYQAAAVFACVLVAAVTSP